MKAIGDDVQAMNKAERKGRVECLSNKEAILKAVKDDVQTTNKAARKAKAEKFLSNVEGD